VKTRVRVKRAAIIKVVEGRVRKAENDYKRAVAAYPGKVEAWDAACTYTPTDGESVAHG